MPPTRRFRSHAGRPARYPLAAIAAYGPDPQRATKLVVSVFERPAQEQAAAVRTWRSAAGDARHDVDIAAEIAAFLDGLGVQRTLMPDRLIGCPHEEGIDYAMGRACPRCPAWAGLDRFTHEPLGAPAPTMSPSQVLEALSAEASEPPREALASADAHRDALFEPLSAVIARGLASPLALSSGDAALLSYALYLLAKWREPRALPLVVGWLSLPGEGPFDLAGDIVTQDGARILAAVSDGNLEPITRLALDRSANEFSRGAAVHALALLGAWAEVPMACVVGRLEWLAREGLEREPSQVWNELATSTVDIEAWSVLDEVRRAYEEGLVDPQVMSWPEVEHAAASVPGDLLHETRERYPPIDDVATATAWWGRFDAIDPELDPESDPHVPYRAPPKVGRNEPCPCGSGKKHKRCCGA